MTNPAIKEDIVFRQEGDEAFSFNADTGEIKLLNEVGAFIWKLCDGEHSKEQIIDKISNCYEEVSKEEIEKDVTEFLKKLKELDYIHIEEI